MPRQHGKANAFKSGAQVTCKFCLAFITPFKKQTQVTRLDLIVVIVFVFGSVLGKMIRLVFMDLFKLAEILV